jgi:putative nucleotidyltransferase with HDIG domain
MVFLTIVAVTGVVYRWGTPFPYHLGEIYPYDVCARVNFDMTDPVNRTSEFRSGMVLVERNTPLTDQHLVLLKEEHRAYQASLDSTAHLKRGAALLLIFFLMGALVVLYVSRFQESIGQNWGKLITSCLLVFLTVTGGLYATCLPGYGLYLPPTIAAMILTLAFNPQFALVVSVNLALALAVALGMDMSHLLVLLSGLSTVVLMLRNVRTRTRLVKVACCAGGVYFVMSLATGLLAAQSLPLIVSDAARRFIWGALAGFLLTGLLPVVERLFGVVTDISLLELADGAHPLLQELVRRAPGTYTHSITVATLAEGAAEAIGANALMVRVGCYFHDIGKMLKPQYFVENQNGENKHDALEPALSTLIIIGHVKDGVALARQYGLPRPVIDFIEQHHGTTLVEYFYREARRLHEANGQHVNGELEAAFRYPGPKPQNRENGILMLADAVESASRALQDPTPTRLKKLIHELLMKRLLDGQFEASGLTLTELHIIEESLCKSLIALFHARIRYHEEDPALTQPLPPVAERSTDANGSGIFTAPATPPK